MDVTSMNNEEFYSLYEQVVAEYRARSVLKGAQETAAALTKATYSARIRVLGTGEYLVWVAPTGAHDAYPIGAAVTHNGLEYVSMMNSNFIEPGTDGTWRRIMPPGEYSPWVQPQGSVGVYNEGDIVSHSDKLWQCVRANNVWEPGTFDSGWEEYTEPPPGNGSEPTVPDPIVADPYVAGTVYSLGAKVAFEGKAYRSNMDGNIWSPTEHPAGWDLLGAAAAPSEPVPEPTPTIAAWVQPQGAHDAYPVGATVTHKGKTWINTFASNVYEPGVYGWNVVT